MARKDIYRITVLNWEKHNGTMKRGHKASLIQNNFCSDAKLRTVPVTVRWLFLGILLICGDHTRDTIEMSERQVRELLESSWSIERALSSLQELGVLTYGKNGPLLIEEKRKEEKRREVEGAPAAPTAQEPLALGDEVGFGPEFQGNSLLDQALPQISKGLQKGWLETYDPTWLKQSLLHAINHHMARQMAQNVTDVKDWPKRFTNWLKQERSPKYRTKPRILKPREAITPWPAGSKERVLGNLSAVNAMSRVKAGNAC